MPYHGCGEIKQITIRDSKEQQITLLTPILPLCSSSTHPFKLLLWMILRMPSVSNSDHSEADPLARCFFFTQQFSWVTDSNCDICLVGLIKLRTCSLCQSRAGMGSSDWHVTIFDIHLQRLPWMYCTGHASQGKWLSRWTGAVKQPSHVVWILEDLKCLGVFLLGVWDTTSGHKAKGSMPLITQRGRHRKQNCSAVFFTRLKKGQSTIRPTLELF